MIEVKKNPGFLFHAWQLHLQPVSVDKLTMRQYNMVNRILTGDKLDKVYTKVKTSLHEH